MKIHRFMGLFFVIFVSFCLGFASFTSRVNGQEGWWPFTEADPPELTALSWKLEEVKQRRDIFPAIELGKDVAIEFVPEFFYVETSDVPVGVGVSVEITYHSPHKLILRRYVYHQVGRVKPIKTMFRDTSFLNRTVEENKELAFGPSEAYREQLKIALNNVVPEAAEELLRQSRQPIMDLASGVPSTNPIQHAFQEFAGRVEHVFGTVYEPRILLDYHKVERVFLQFCFHQEELEVKVVRFKGDDVPFLGVIFPDSEVVVVARVRWERTLADTNLLAEDAAKQVFRAVLASK